MSAEGRVPSSESVPEAGRPPHEPATESRRHSTWKRWAYGLGSLLAVLGLVFVARRLFVLWPQIAPRVVEPGTLFDLLRATLWCGLGAFGLAVAWGLWLGPLGAPTRLRVSIPIFARSQIAKYVPGNFFQWAGRQLLAERAGLPRLPVAASAVVELAGLVFVAASLASMTWFLFLRDVQPSAPARLVLTLLATGTALVAIFATTRWLLRRQQRQQQEEREAGAKAENGAEMDTVSSPPVYQMLLPLGLNLLFFTLAAHALRLLVEGLGTDLSMGLCLAVGSLSWITGVLTPGAPAPRRALEFAKPSSPQASAPRSAPI